MKKFITLLAICLLIFSCQSNSEDSETTGKGDVTREKFAVIAKNGTGAIDASWESPELLVLTFKTGSLEDRIKAGIDKDGNQTYEPQAVGMARGNAILGSEATKLKTCVRVRYEDGQELSEYCADYP